MNKLINHIKRNARDIVDMTDIRPLVANIFYEGKEKIEKYHGFDYNRFVESVLYDIKTQYDDILKSIGIPSSGKVKPKTRDELKLFVRLLTSELDRIDTSLITNMNGIFENFDNIEGIDNWDVSNVKTMKGMFSNCSFSKDLNLSKWDVSSATDMSSMFSGTTGNIPKGLDKWNISKVDDMSYMFYNCKNVNIDLSSWDVTTIKHYAMFSEKYIPNNLPKGYIDN